MCVYCDREMPADTGVRVHVPRREASAPGAVPKDERGAQPAIANGLSAILSRRAQGKSRADEEKAADHRFLFAPGNDGGWIVCGVADTVPADLEIPSAHQGGPVAEIGPEAFRGLRVARVRLPSSLRRIGSGAFRDCSLLYEVTGGENIQLIGKEAFRGCCRLCRFPMLKTGGVSISYSSFAGCYQLGLAMESGCVPDE